MINIDNKTIALLGCTGIIGSELANFLGSSKINLILGDINIDKCKKIKEDIEKLNICDITVIKIDVYDEKSIFDFFNNIKKTHEKLDVLINNFQVKPKGFYSSFLTYPKDVLMKVLEGNLVGATICSQEACKIFIKQGFGNIINIGSVYGIVAPDQRIYEESKNIYSKETFNSPVSYAISKAGIIHLTKYLASYYRQQNIRVNCLSPGGVFDNHDDSFNANYSKRTLIGRMADKSDFNGAIAFLCSDSSRYMTGENLVIDGGWTVI